MLTVKALRAILDGLADNVIVAVGCENRCDPHPLMDGKYAMSGPYEKMVYNARSRSDDDLLRVNAIVLFSDEGIDLASYDDGSDEDETPDDDMRANEHDYQGNGGLCRVCFLPAHDNVTRMTQ